MNTEDFVTYEQAIALKELGFDYDCDHYYINDYDDLQVSTSYYNHNDNVLRYSAPTIAHAQRWLRYNKKLSVEIFSDIDINEKELAVIIADKRKSLRDFESIFLNENFDSYEEALNKGITKCINILKNNN